MHDSDNCNESLNKLIMCLAIEIHSKLTILLIMNKKTKFDLINPADLGLIFFELM